MNIFTFYGHAGDSAIVRELDNGSAVLEVSVANNQGFGEKQKTNWVRVTLFGARVIKLGEYIRKGSLLFVSGELSISEYHSKADGTKKFQMNVKADHLELLGKNPNGSNNTSNYHQPSISPATMNHNAEFDLEDIMPF
jgi:single-strand DNA-binding protein